MNVNERDTTSICSAVKGTGGMVSVFGAVSNNANMIFDCGPTHLRRQQTPVFRHITLYYIRIRNKKKLFSYILLYFSKVS